MTFRKKLLLAFCVMTVPLAVIGGQALWSVHEQTAFAQIMRAGFLHVNVFASLEREQ